MQKSLIEATILLQAYNLYTLAYIMISISFSVCTIAKFYWKFCICIHIRMMKFVCCVYVDKTSFLIFLEPTHTNPQHTTVSVFTT